MMRILIPVDGSKTSLTAIDYVVKRQRRGERVEAFILNVQPAISPKAGLITRGMIKDYQAQESERALAKPDLAPMKRYLQADTYVEIGDPATCIILGSVANKVIQNFSHTRGRREVSEVLRLHGTIRRNPRSQ